MQQQPEIQLWTPRWTPIRERGLLQLSGPRREYWECEKRFIVVAAGARSLKTEIAKRKLIKKFTTNVFTNNKGYFDERYFFAGPTKEQTKEIAWEDLQAMVPSDLIYNINHSRLTIELVYGPRLQLVGLDKAQRMEGRPWDGGVITEFADIKPGTWDANFRPLLADRLGWVILEGRPDFDKANNDKFEELFEKGLSGDNPDWVSYNWSSADVMLQSELDDAMETMDEDIFAQEFHGSFIKAPGRAYAKFVRSLHVRDDIAYYHPDLALRVSCDFNYGHHNWGMYQILPHVVIDEIEMHDVAIAPDEIYQNEATVESMCADLKSRLETMRPRELIFHGDYSGQNKTAQATFDSWRQIRNEFPDAEFRYDKQPPVADRINRVNARLKNAKGVTRLYINSKCNNLNRDLGKVTRKMLFSQIKEGDLTHASDNLGYFLCQYEE